MLICNDLIFKSAYQSLHEKKTEISISEEYDLVDRIREFEPREPNPTQALKTSHPFRRQSSGGGQVPKHREATARDGCPHGVRFHG
jgi:hypothetical protein